MEATAATAQMSLLCRGSSARLRRGRSAAADGGAGEGREAEEEVDEVNDEPVRPSWSSAGFSSEMTLWNVTFYEIALIISAHL